MPYFDAFKFVGMFNNDATSFTRRIEWTNYIQKNEFIGFEYV